MGRMSAFKAIGGDDEIDIAAQIEELHHKEEEEE